MVDDSEKQEAPVRTEEEIIAQIAVVVIFGKARYEIAPLTIRKAITWRKHLAANIDRYTSAFKGNLTLDMLSASNVLKLAATAFTEIPDVLLDSVKQYAPDLPWEKIENEGTSAQVTDAFKEVFNLEFPFLQGVDPAGVIKTLRSLQ